MPDNYVSILVRSRDQAKPDLDELKGRLEELKATVATARAEVDDKDAAAKLDMMNARLLALDKRVASPRIDMSSAVRAEAQVHQIEAQLDAMGPKVQDDLKKAGGEGGLGMVDAIIAAGLAGAPLVVGALTAGIGPAIDLLGSKYPQLTAGYAPIMQEARAQTLQWENALQDAAGNAIPGISKALYQAEPAVDAMTGGVRGLGTTVGSVFSTITSHSEQLSGGITGTFNIVDHVLGETATLINSTARGMSGALSGLSVPLDGLLAGVQHITTPATAMAGAGALIQQRWNPLGSILGGASTALQSVGTKAAGVAETGSRLETAATKAFDFGGSMQKAADVMGGPWGVAVGAGIGLLGGFIGQATRAAASASDFTAAIAADSDTIGANTDAQIQNILQANNLVEVFAQVGVSEATLISYAAGNATAQRQVTDALNSKQQALTQTSIAEGVHSKAEFDAGNAADRQASGLNNAKRALDQVTTAVAAAYQQQTRQNEALLVAEQATDVFSAAVSAAQTQLQQQNEQLKINATALNMSLDAQGQLNDAAINASVDYQEASNATSAYTNALDALYGQYGAANDAQAKFTTDLDGLTGKVSSGKDAVNLFTAAGAKNYEALYKVATAAETAAEQIYKTTGNSSQADAALQRMAGQLDAAAKQAGLTSSQISGLNKELFGVPDIKDIHISADTGQATSALNGLLSQIAQLSSAGNLTVMPTIGSRVIAHAAGGVIGAAATGGVRGSWTTINEQGDELVQLPSGSTVFSNPDTQRMLNDALGGSGAGTLQLEWVGSNAGDEFLTWLRKNIRVRGGSGPNSVQRVLGQSV